MGTSTGAGASVPGATGVTAGAAGQGSAGAHPTLLNIRGLRVAFPTAKRTYDVVRDVSFRVGAGEFVGLVGESGCGKSMIALSIMRLVPHPGEIVSGSIYLEDEDLLQLSEAKMRAVRGARIAIVFQEPMTALNPVFTIGYQIVEAIRVHRRMSKAEAEGEARRLLELVAIPDPGDRLRNYPHQLSGGQRQRAMIAMALASDPDLLLADEPTTALDVTIQAQILELLERLRQELRLGVLLITHDLAVVAETCDRVVVMYAGEVVEEADVDTLFRRPAHPYTQGLLAALPRLGKPGERGRLPSIQGQVPDPAARPSGCAFHPRCPHAWDLCAKQEPPLFRLGAGRLSRCFRVDSERVDAPGDGDAPAAASEAEGETA